MSKIALSGDASGTGTFTIASPNSNNNRTLTIPDAAGTLALLQTPSFATTIGVGGATPATTGVGITFPAAFSGSSDANTLDDYEEGNFTPTVRGATTAGTITYDTTNTFGRYVKIGPLVNFQLAVVVTAGSGASGDFQVTNLPFTVRNFTGYFPSAVVGYFFYASTGWTQYDQTALLRFNTTIISIYYASNTGSLPTAASVINGSSSIFISGSYLTDS
jgi:hypothetical protein